MTQKQAIDGKELQEIFVRHYLEINTAPIPPFTIQLYPYSSFRHTMRVRGGKILVRLSDIIIGAPDSVLSAILAILLYKLFGKSIPHNYSRHYREYVSRERVRRRTRQIHAFRGRKPISTPEGSVYNLANIFSELNERYFAQLVSIQHLSWSQQINHRVWGHYNPTHDKIVVNRALDHSQVPYFVVEYVLFHEMLHSLQGDYFHRGRQHVHPSWFSVTEKQLPHYQEAREFLKSRFRGDL